MFEGQSIGQYDIALSPIQNGLLKLEPEDHVGNLRFQVLLGIRSDAFRLAEQREDKDECNKIVHEIIDIICNQCSPVGRFLVNDKTGKYVEILEGGETKEEFVYRSLQQSSTPNLLRSRSESPSCETRVSFPSPPRRRFLANYQEEGKAGERNRKGTKRCMGFGSVSERMVKNAKQRRTASFCSRVSKSFSLKESSVIARIPSNSVTSLSLNTNDISSKDVLLSTDRKSLSAKDCIGNNRFRVIIQIYTEKFRSADQEGRKEIVDTMVGMVLCSENADDMKSRGRFLIQDTEFDYVCVLDKEEAHDSIMGIMEAETEDVEERRLEAVQCLLARKRKQKRLRDLGKKALAKNINQFQWMIENIPSGTVHTSNPAAWGAMVVEE